MKLIVIALLVAVIAAPAYATTKHCHIVTTGHDSENHQSSLSSTTGGGDSELVCHTVCTHS